MSSYTEQALVFIGSAVLLVPLFHRLGFGSVLGYLIAGIVVGPFGLKLIKDAESVLHFSELGVVLLLFVIGLEIQPRKLWSMKTHLLGLGGLQVALSTLVFLGIGLAFGLPALMAGTIGFALSLSSTAFAVQTLTERNQFNTEFGRASFSILLMQDLVAIPALAIIPALGVSAASEGSGALRHLPLAFALIAGLIVASRFLIRPAFRLIASTRSREIFTAATLFIVLGVSALMQKVELSAALGTFIAGVLLADSEYRHELEADLEPFKSLLMGLFFIAVGMGVNLGLLLEKPFLVFGLALSYIALKGLLIYGIGRAFGLRHENSRQMALSIAQGGEFAFVIFGILVSSKIAPESTIELLTAVVTISMALSPLTYLANDRLSDYRQKRAAPPTYDVIKDETPQVIIAGFGRFGQIFGRLLRAQNFPFVAIDHDADQVELVRRFGNMVYYGDASRVDLLEAAGAKKAKYFILAIDDPEQSLAAAKTVLEHFPHLQVFARARNRGHAFDLMDLGIKRIKRETFESSLFFVEELLIEMGFAPEKARTIIEKFKRHDEIMLIEQYKVRADDKQFVSVSKQSTAQLAQVLSDDTMQSHISPR